MIQSALRLVSVTAAFVSMPVMALLCSQVARTASDAYVAFLGGRPLPQLTQIWIVGITQSALFVPAVFVVAIFLWGFSLYLLKREGPWTLTGILLLSVLGFMFSLLLVGTTCLSASLPFVTIQTRMEP